MSFNTIARAANDADLQKRIAASVNAEALNNPVLKETEFARQVRNNFGVPASMYWAVAVSVQLQYETGINNGRGSPGYDDDVVSDGDITAAVNANWPPDPAP